MPPDDRENHILVCDGTPGLTDNIPLMKRLTRRRFACVASLWMCLCAGSTVALGESYIEGFEGESKSWQILRGSSRTNVLRQERTNAIHHAGQRSEALMIETYANDGMATLVHKLPAAIRFDELKASVWVWSDHPGVQAAVRVRLPNQPDQRTGQTLVVDVYGDIHQGNGQWQQLNVDLSDRNFEETMRRVRNELNRRLGIRAANDEGAYVEQFSLRLPEAAGELATWKLAIDDLEMTPVVAPQASKVVQDESSESVGPRIRIGDDRVLLDGVPFFPRFIPYHGESSETLQKSLCNVVWVPDYEDRNLLLRMDEAGLGVMATPPQPDLETETAEPAGLLPFTAQTDPILLWMLDVQIPSSRLQQASAWAELVRDADHARARPIMADVVGREREYDRELSLLGVSRSILHTTKTPRIYAESLDQRMRMGLPGKPKFTLIPTSPAAELMASRPARSTVPVVEPEQLWMQSNVAIAAGFKGIGYLTRDSLESTDLGAEERRRAMEIQNLQIELLEPWLATAKVLQLADVQVGNATQASRLGQSALFSRWDKRPGVTDHSPEAIVARQICATVLECDQGLMILVNWLEDDSQYQPSRMVARDVHLLVNRDIAQASELTTTSLDEHTLSLKDVAGGTEITLRELNQSAVLLVTLSSDHQAKDTLVALQNQMRPQASEAWSSLGRAKLTRVRDVHHQLLKLGTPPVTNAEAVLRNASNLVDQAEKFHQAGRYTEVEKPVRMALADLRDLEWTHWKIAVRGEKSPASSPHTICFQTLPDHWRMKEALKRSTSVSENLLKSGDFDDGDSVLVGWTSSSALPEDSPINTTAALEGPAGASCLHMGAATPSVRGAGPLNSLEQTPVSTNSPAMSVSVGQIIRVRGRIRIRKSIEATTDGFLIYDSLAGTAGALRFREPTLNRDWQDFEYYREVARSGEIRLLFELQGLGDVWLDDLQVTATQPLEESEKSSSERR